MLINNPSNPLGSNWSREHVKQILDYCDKNKLVVVADETYE